MNTQIESLVKQARNLSPEEQAILAETLYEMINPPDPAWEEAWAKECESRLAAYQKGEIESVDSDEAMAFLRKKHGLK
ncbi:MAG: addiction module protein [Gallionella sp.]|nr:addiction module protein [Gallionella sp.]